METISTNCPECGLSIEYWTTRDYFECPKCKYKIEAEPCEIENNVNSIEDDKDD